MKSFHNFARTLLLVLISLVIAYIEFASALGWMHMPADFRTQGQSRGAAHLGPARCAITERGRYRIEFCKNGMGEQSLCKLRQMPKILPRTSLPKNLHSSGDCILYLLHEIL